MLTASYSSSSFGGDDDGVVRFIGWMMVDQPDWKQEKKIRKKIFIDKF